MPSYCVDMIKDYCEVLQSTDYKQMYDEIEEVDCLGHKCDEDTWNNFKLWLQDMIMEEVQR